MGFVLRVLEEGDVFLVDEIDSSLHPVLSSTLIRMFKDPVINPKGAQMVFASHDTTLLGTMLENKLLERDEVWFTEKDAHGATSLYSLVEFHPRGDENPERGYLQGRYGAVPHVNFQEIRSLFAELHGAAGEPSASAETGPPPESQYA
ncbi:MAG: ATP-binding protein [Thermobifida fusca]|uniref:AAA family ATPase n=1 Tax=Thermobifida TaxID=83677 RepID=UPI0021587B7A|nr:MULTISPECIES: ATP-binding protein [Thermobifida]